jgi:hypothetical protein
MQREGNKHLCLIAGALLLGSCCGAQAAGASLPAGEHTSAAQPTPVPAEWQTFDILVDFQSLPRTYSCDELWYKFRDVLRILGARAYMTITPYDCGYVGGVEAYSPRVEVKFQLPRLLHGRATQYAQVSVVEKSIRLTPGSPSSLGTQDCEFAKQLDTTFFPALPVSVETADFRCSATIPTYAMVINARVVAPASPGTPAAPAAHS